MKVDLGAKHADTKGYAKRDKGCLYVLEKGSWNANEVGR